MDARLFAPESEKLSVLKEDDVTSNELLAEADPPTPGAQRVRDALDVPVTVSGALPGPNGFTLAMLTKPALQWKRRGRLEKQVGRSAQ